MSDTPKRDNLMSEAQKRWQSQACDGDKSLVEVTCEMLFERFGELERELNESNEYKRRYQSLVGALQQSNEELQLQLQGYTKCEVCNGDCGRHTGSVGRLGSPVDPQTWVDCDACKGEGWVR